MELQAAACGSVPMCLAAGRWCRGRKLAGDRRNNNRNRQSSPRRCLRRQRLGPAATDDRVVSVVVLASSGRNTAALCEGTGEAKHWTRGAAGTQRSYTL
jgi:hypothetical protein